MKRLALILAAGSLALSGVGCGGWNDRRAECLEAHSPCSPTEQRNAEKAEREPECWNPNTGAC